MKKLVGKEEVKKLVKPGMTMMIGGFMSCGTPEGLIDILIEEKIGDLTIICNDTSVVDKGIGRLVVAGLVCRVITSHIGTNPQTGILMTQGSIKVDLVPQGTLIERIRAGGAGLGGFLTPTGVGTLVEEGKQKLNVEGKDYILELPLRADLALVRGSIVDHGGNVVYKGTTRNFNPIIATAADIVIVEVEKMVNIGEIEPEYVMTPGPLVDYLYQVKDA